jgi:hypothetical protein
MDSRCFVEKYDYFAQNNINISTHIITNISDFESFFYIYFSYKCDIVQNNGKFISLYYPNYDFIHFDTFFSLCDNKRKIYHLFDSFLYFSDLLKKMQCYDLYFINFNVNNILFLESNQHCMMQKFEKCVKKSDFMQFIPIYMKNINSHDILPIDLLILHLFYNTNISTINTTNIKIVVNIIEKNNTFLKTIYGEDKFKMLIIKYIRMNYLNKTKSDIIDYIYQNIDSFPIYSLTLIYAELFWSYVNVHHSDNVFFLKTMSFFRRNLHPDINKRFSIENSIHFLQNHFNYTKNINYIKDFINLMTSS